MSLRTDHVELGGVRLELARPVDAEALIDEREFARDEFLPYWAELWPSGRALADHVAGLELDGCDVLELGCGLGLPSLIAATRGARVLATDWAGDAIMLLSRNAARNALELDAELLDWRDPEMYPTRRFDVALAADALYEQRNVEPLLCCLAATLAPNGRALVADPGRRHAASFPERAASEGWLVTVHEARGLPAGGIWSLRRS